MTSTTTSPGPGSGITMSTNSTGCFLDREMTPRTVWLMAYNLAVEVGSLDGDPRTVSVPRRTAARRRRQVGVAAGRVVRRAASTRGDPGGVGALGGRAADH